MRVIPRLREELGRVHVARRRADPARRRARPGEAGLARRRRRRTRARLVRRRGGRGGGGHHAPHQRGRGGHADQPAGDRAARRAATGDARERPRAPARALPRPAARVPVFAGRVGDRRRRRGRSSSAASRWACSSAAAPARRHPQDERTERGAHDLLPQQRAAPVRAAVAGRLCVHQQPGDAPEDIQRLAWRVYPYVAPSFSCAGARKSCRASSTACLLRWRRRACWNATRTARSGAGRPRAVPEAMQLSMLAQATIQTIERYYLAIALLLRAGRRP